MNVELRASAFVTLVMAMICTMGTANAEPMKEAELSRPLDSRGLRKGPYLLYPGVNTEMTVLWQVEEMQTSTLEWGEDTSYGTGSVVTEEYGDDHQHSFTIEDLTPGTKYYYRLTLFSGEVETGSFTAAPDAFSTDVKFLAYGDTRSLPAYHDTVNEEMIDTYTVDPDYQTLTLLAGDWVNNGDIESDWDTQIFDPAYLNTHEFQANMPINGCIGNHEFTGGGYDKYWPYPYVTGTDFYWSFDYGPAHIAVVDQYISYDPGSPQYDWLENDLATSTALWKFLLFHEPGWSAGGHGNNVTVQTYIQPLCLAYGVDIVFAGHNHYYARCNADGIQHVTTGGGGAPLSMPSAGYPNVVESAMALHFCMIEIQGDELYYTAVNRYGELLDAFTLIHGVDNMAPMPDPTTWEVEPAAAGATSISMTATTASDPSGVEYYFECTSGGGNDSGWQDGPAYTDTGLAPATEYTYRVKARDLSAGQNEAGWSDEASVTTDEQTPCFVGVAR